MTEKKHFLLIDITEMPGVINASFVKLASHGSEEILIESIAVAIVASARLRKIINAAGAMANKIRRGEMAAPGKFTVNDN